MSSVKQLRDTRGFTLVEVMVALMLSALLAGILFQIVRGQARFATVQSAQQEVQQNARGALEIVASELRGVQAVGVVSSSAHSITFLLPRIWGVSCGGGTNQALPAILPEVPDGTVMYNPDAAAGVMGDLQANAASTVPVWSPVPTSTLGNRATLTSMPAQNPALGAAGNVCAAVRSSAGGGVMRGVTLTGQNLPLVPAGKPLYVYTIARYDVGTANGAASDEYWVRRSTGVPGAGGTQQPLAGPLTSANGLEFTYFKADGTVFTPGDDAAQLALIARIGIKVAARSRTTGRANLADSVTTSVLLRNN